MCFVKSNIRKQEMTRRETSFLKCVTSNDGQARTWIMIFHNDFLAAGEGKTCTSDLVKLRHPRSGGSAMFLFSHDNSVVQEVFSLSEKRSWFINDCVRENGKIYFSTPVDPLFLVLPYLKKTGEKNKFIPLEDLLADDVFPETLRVLKLLAIKNIHLLADRKGPEDLNAWKYNEEKAMKWLYRKTEKVAKILQEKQVNVGGSATSKNFIKSAKGEFSDSGRECYIKWAHELVSEYLLDDLSIKLSLILGLPGENSGKMTAIKRKFSRTEEQEVVKKKKIEGGARGQKEEKSKNLSAKEKAMMKAASGSKSITSFFLFK